MRISRWFGPLRTLFILYAQQTGLRPLPYTICSFIGGVLTWMAAWQVGLWLGGVAFVAVWHRYQIYGLIGLVVIGNPAFLIYRHLRARRKDGFPHHAENQEVHLALAPFPVGSIKDQLGVRSKMTQNESCAQRLLRCPVKLDKPLQALINRLVGTDETDAGDKLIKTDSALLDHR